MRKATVYLNQEAVGKLIETPDGFIFRYDDIYILWISIAAIKLRFQNEPVNKSKKQIFQFFAGIFVT